VAAANEGRTGVRIDWQRYQAYQDEHALRLAADPWMRENRAIYHASQVYAGHNIWLPSPAYVRMLQGAGVIGTRPDWVNAAVDVGKGIAGFHAGLVVGVFGSLWDTLAGLWELGETVVGVITRALDGSLFADLEALYDELRNLSWQKARDMVASVVTMARDALGDFVTQWNHPDVFQQWFFRGRIAGAVALEVVLAIISGGGTLGAKVAAKIGQYAPRLARALGKVLQFADDLDFTPSRQRGHGHGSGSDGAGAGASGRGAASGGDRPGDRDRDMNEDERDFAQTLAMARMVTEAHDLRDTPVDELLLQLDTTLAARSRAVRGYKAYPHPTRPDHHRIVQFSREREVDGDYSGKNPTSDTEKSTGQTAEASASSGEVSSTRTFRTPASRHQLRSVKQGTYARDLNTVIEPGVDVAGDIAAINRGLAKRIGNTFEINGRSYGVKEGGTLYPISGPGFHQLNRGAFQALGVLNKFGNTPIAMEILSKMKNVGPAEIDAALRAWRAGQ
jgi:hypothetical protein